MTRITDSDQNRILLDQLMRVNARVAEDQRQLSSGKKADQFKDIGSDIGKLLSTKRVEEQLVKFEETSARVETRLNFQEAQIGTLSDIALKLKDLVINAVGQDTALGFMDEVRSIFEQAAAILNSRVNGEYVFGGTRTDVAPLNVTTLADLDAAGSVAAVFENNSIKMAARIDEGLTMEFGFLADDVATSLMTSFKAIAGIDSGGSGPLTGTLTATQRTLLRGEIVPLNQVVKDINIHETRNGLLQNRISDIQQRHEEMAIFLKTVISDIEDVDIAEAINRLNADQDSLGVSTRVLAGIRQYSLLDFI